MNSLDSYNDSKRFPGFGGMKGVEEFTSKKCDYIPRDVEFWFSPEYEKFLMDLSTQFPSGTRVQMRGKQWNWKVQELEEISIEGVLGSPERRFEGAPLAIPFLIQVQGETFEGAIPPTFFLEGFQIEKI